MKYLMSLLALLKTTPNSEKVGCTERHFLVAFSEAWCEFKWWKFKLLGKTWVDIDLYLSEVTNKSLDKLIGFSRKQFSFLGAFRN